MTRPWSLKNYTMTQLRQDPLEAILVVFGCSFLIFLFKRSWKNMKNDTTFVRMGSSDHLGNVPRHFLAAHSLPENRQKHQFHHQPESRSGAEFGFCGLSPPLELGKNRSKRRLFLFKTWKHSKKKISAKCKTFDWSTKNEHLHVHGKSVFWASRNTDFTQKFKLIVV